MKHLSLQALCGAVLGWIAGVTLMSLATPDASKIIVTPAMAADLERMARLAEFARKAHWLWACLLLAAFSASWLLAALRIAPDPGRSPLKRSAAVLFSGLAVLFGTARILSSLQAGCCMLSGGDSIWDTAPAYVAQGALLWGLAWVILDHRRLWTNAALGTLSGLLATGVVYGITGFFYLLFTLNVSLWTYSAEVAYGGLVRNLLICSGLGAAAFASAMGLSAAVGADQAPLLARLNRASLPVVLCAVLAAGFGLLRLYAGRHDYGNSLAAAAGLKGTLGRQAAILLPALDGKSRVVMQSSPLDAHYYGFADSGAVPASDENLEALTRFLSARARDSVLRNAAVNSIPSACLTLWKPSCLASRYEEVLSSLGPGFGVPVLWTSQRLAWLADRAPATDENRRMLENIRSSGLRLPQNALEKLARGEARYQGPSSGVVRGDFRIEGARDPGRVTIGLFLLPDEKGPPPLLQSCVVDSRPFKDGRFEFTRLTPGEYFLALLVPEQSIHSAQVGKHPGRMRVDAKRPVFETGTIELAVKK